MSPPVRSLITWISIALAGRAFAVVWHVPQDMATIQAAMNATGDGDSIIVAPGVFQEALQAPSHRFWLIGEIDSTANPDRPLIDPSLLDGSSQFACLTLPPQSQAGIENIDFRNGPEMYPRAANVGGIDMNGAKLILTHCRLDSTYNGLYCSANSLDTLLVSDCEFVENVSFCLYAVTSGVKIVRNSSLSGRGSQLMRLNDGALVEQCSFHDKPDPGEWIWLMGEHITLRGCDFGPTVVPAHAIIWTSGSRGCLFEDNVFHDLELTGAAVIFGGIAYNVPGDTSYFLRNSYVNNSASENSQGGAGLRLEQQGSMMPVMAVQDCIFENCFASQAAGFGGLCLANSRVTVKDCRFHGQNPDVPAPALQCIHCYPSTITQCFFENTGVALLAQDMEPDTLNAEGNWWNHPTGPRHEPLNPHGLGDEVVGAVDFVPWVFDTTNEVSEGVPAVPVSASISVSPNPFNSTATISLHVGTPGDYSLELYNVLGQRVQQVWSGVVATDKRIAMNGTSLASGVYVLRVTPEKVPGGSLSAKVLVLK